MVLPPPRADLGLLLRVDSAMLSGVVEPSLRATLQEHEVLSPQVRRPEPAKQARRDWRPRLLLLS